MEMYHGKREEQHKQMLIQLLIHPMKNEQLSKEDEKASTKLLYVAEFTNRLSILTETAEMLSKDTNQLFAKILKELGNEAFLIV